MLAIVTGILGTALGFLAGAITMVRTPSQQTAPTALPPHEHLWGEWEQADPVKLHNAAGDWYADEYRQHRQCVTCGWLEHQTTRI